MRCTNWLQWPEEKQRLLENPELIDTAVDEFLRFQSPNQLGNRMTAEPAEFHGEIVPAGTRIHLCIGAANRDPRHFTEPDRLDIARKPNKHLAFAGGPHLCVGFSLARMEGRIAVSRFLKRFPGLHAGRHAEAHRPRALPRFRVVAGDHELIGVLR